MNIKKIFAAVLAVCMVTSAASAETGVATYFGRWRGGSIDAIDKMDITWVRDMQDWRDIETEKGKLAIPEDRIECYKRVVENGQKIILCLGCGNPLYNKEESHIVMPTADTPEYVEAWLDYVTFTVSELKGLVTGYEIWNEPNYPQYNSNGTGAQYGWLFAQTYAAIKAVDENAIVLGGAVAAGNEASFEYTKEFYKNGGSCMDGFSYHIYGIGSAPEVEWTRRLTRMEETLDELGYQGRVWVSESGYYTGTYKNSITEAEQAAYVLRVYALWDKHRTEDGHEGVLFWFSVMDAGSNINNSEHNYGLLDCGFAAKPSYYAMQLYNKLTADKKPASASGEYLVSYRNDDGETAHIAWSADGEKTISVPLCGDRAYVYDYLGSIIRTIENPEGTLTLTVDEYPQAVECVRNRTTIDEMSYNRSKNVLHISGSCNYADRVTVEIVQNDETVQAMEIPVKNGAYEKEFSVNASGETDVFAGRIEGAGQNLYDSEKFIAAPSAVEITSVTVDETTGIVEAAGRTDGADKVAVIAVPYSVDMQQILPQNVAYIGDAAADGGNFTVQFKMPPESEGKYRLFAGAAGAFAAESGFTTGEAGISVCCFEISGSDEITVFAAINNTSWQEKPAVMIIAQYTADGVLADVAANPVGMAQATVQPQMYSFSTARTSDTAYVRAYIFDSIEGMTPLTPGISLLAEGEV